jgi:hypothetical protein
MQNPVEDLLMNTHGQSSLLEYPLSRRNSFNWLYHICPDCFKPYKDLGSYTQYMYPLSRRNSFNWLYHICPDCFKPYKDLGSYTQYMLRFACIFGIEIPSGTFMYISESSDPYKYVATTSVNFKDR